MEIIFILLLINYLISRLLIKLMIIQSALYVENSKILQQEIPEHIYNTSLKIYNNHKSLNNAWYLHIPIFNIWYCFVMAYTIIDTYKKIKK
jgi:hypothetical protein